MSLLREKIEQYRNSFLPWWRERAGETEFEREREVLARFERLLEQKDCFERSHLPGHVTGSAFILNPNQDQLVLMHHRKLGIWVQTGGHTDGNPDVLAVALREAEEESGQIGFVPWERCLEPVKQTVLPIDFDIHLIPRRGKEPPHWHYDVRFVLVSAESALVANEESFAIRWFDLADAAKLGDESLKRVVRKIDCLKTASFGEA